MAEFFIALTACVFGMALVFAGVIWVLNHPELWWPRR